MNNEDWAIVVGINQYPGIFDLKGAENDAQLFYEWLISPKGGAIPVFGPPADDLSPGNQVKLIKSSDFAPGNNASVAKPTQIEVYAAFDYLHSLGEQNFLENGRRRVGRRLYLYFSGHGFVPSGGDTPGPGDAAILMANSDATLKSWGNHIPGNSYAHWFYNSGIFNEIILFMDCCRDNNPNYPKNPVHYAQVNANQHDLANRKSYFGFGTKWNNQSREREMDDNNWHGVFTTALLAGLKGAAADIDSGNVHAKSLNGYLRNYMKTYFSDQDRDNPNIDKEPGAAMDPLDIGDQIVFSKPPAASTRFPVTINLLDDLMGQNIQVIGERNNQQNMVIQETTVNTQNWNFEIEPGLYTLISSGGREQLIEVIGHITANGRPIGKVKVPNEQKEKDYVTF